MAPPTYLQCRSVGVALLALVAGGCDVDRSGAARVGVDGSVAVRDGGRRDAGDEGDGDGGTTPAEDGSAARDSGTDTDAGSVTTDAGPPPDVAFEVRVDGTYCPALASCGGALEGTWQVSGGCVDFVQVNTLRSVCPSASVRGTGTARGRVTFAGTTMTRNLDVDWRGAVGIPGSCSTLVGGCGAVESTVRANVPGAAVSCPPDGAGGCACTLTIGRTLADTSTIRLEGNQFVRDADARRWEYCVSGSSLRYRETTGVHEPGAFAFTQL